MKLAASSLALVLTQAAVQCSAPLDMDRWFPEDVRRVSRDGEGGKKGGRYRV